MWIPVCLRYMRNPAATRIPTIITIYAEAYTEKYTAATLRTAATKNGLLNKILSRNDHHNQLIISYIFINKFIIHIKYCIKTYNISVHQIRIAFTIIFTPSIPSSPASELTTEYIAILLLALTISFTNS